MKNQRIKDANKIKCNRGKGQIISAQDCVPGCNDVCLECENQQTQNIPASADIVTAAEEAENKYDGTYRSSAAVAMDDGYRDK